MRGKTPEPFTATFIGPEGVYDARFQQYDEWDGFIETEIAGVSLYWNVDNVEIDEAGGIELGGITQGTEALWNDCFWFELIITDHPVEIRYWGDGFIWRTDKALKV